MQIQSAERVGDKVSVVGNVYSEMIDLIAQGCGPASVIAFGRRTRCKNRFTR